MRDPMKRSPALNRSRPAIVAVWAVLVIAGWIVGSRGGAEPVKLPGLEVRVTESCVDIKATVCLEEGTLELVACTKDTKEHESIVAVEAKAVHIHTALLLLGVKPGTPAGHQAVDEEETRWVPVAPSGGLVRVSLVTRDKSGKSEERSITKFIRRVEGAPVADGDDGSFSTDQFVFAGSRLQDVGEGPRRYLADASGNVISISTFGDETLCLPGMHGHENGALLWEVNPEHLPAVGSEVILRLRPVRQGEQAGGQSDEKK